MICLAACSRSGPQVARDLLHETRQAQVLQETDVLDVGTLAARPSLGEGWSVDETVPEAAACHGDTTFVWAVGEASELSSCGIADSSVIDSRCPAARWRSLAMRLGRSVP